MDRKALVRDASLSLAEGALDLWPSLAGPAEKSLGRPMLEALCAATGLPIDVPLGDLSGLQQRVLFEGTGERWIEVRRPAAPEQPRPKGERKRRGSGSTDHHPWFAFQFKGLEAACEEAARLVVAVRSKVDAVMDEVPCSECGGSRLADVASAVTLWGRSLDVWCRMPLGRLQQELARV